MNHYPLSTLVERPNMSVRACERDDDLGAFKGMLLSLPISVALWAILALLVF